MADPMTQSFKRTPLVDPHIKKSTLSENGQKRSLFRRHDVIMNITDVKIDRIIDRIVSERLK